MDKQTLDYIITNIVLPLFIGWVGAYSYSKFGMYVRNRNLASRQKKLSSLLIYYYYIKKMKNSSEYMNYQWFVGIQTSILWLGILVVSCAFLLLLFALPNESFALAKRIGYGVGIIFVSFSLFYFLIVVEDYRRQASHVFDFDKFREESINKLKKFGFDTDEVDIDEIVAELDNKNPPE